MIDPTVRRAEHRDGPELRWVESEARAALAGRRGADRWLTTHPPVDLEWEETIARGGVVVAHIDDVVVGYIVMEVDGAVATVKDVFVIEGARELGFGDALLEAATRLARDQRAGWLEGEALPGDRHTKNLYERAGIKARLITVSTEL
jgi:GNAT superfamily N-acetyltransferase